MFIRRIYVCCVSCSPTGHTLPTPLLHPLSHQDHGIVVLPQRIIFAMVRHSQRLQPTPIRPPIQFTHDQHGLVGGVHFDRRSQRIRQRLNFNLPTPTRRTGHVFTIPATKHNPNGTHTKRTHTKTKKKSQQHKRGGLAPTTPKNCHRQTYSSKSPSTKGEKSLGLFFMCAVAIFLISKHALLLLNSSLLRNAN